MNIQTANSIKFRRRRRTRRIRTACIVAIILCLIAFALLAGFYFGYQAGFGDGRMSRIPAADTLISTGTLPLRSINL